MADGATAATPYSRAERPAGPTGDPQPPRHPPRGPSRFTGSPPSAPGAGGATAEDGGRVTSIDGRRFRTVLGRFATGVVAVAAIDPGTGRPNGLAANSFTSVSLDPPLVSFCVAHTSTTWPRLRGAARLCVNVLSASQREVCLRLAARGGEKFAGLEWSPSPGGGPVIEGVLAWLECSVETEYAAGDHMIVLARVHHLDRHQDGEPLIFYQGAYGSFQG